MKKRVVIFCLAIAFTNPLLAAPIQAVIGLNNSQITESNQSISLTPNSATILPLDDDFPPLSLSQNAAHSNWLNALGNKVKVEHKQRDLSYTGMLVKIEGNAFLLEQKTSPILLPLNDFYLIPLDSQKTNKGTPQYSSTLSYQTNLLSWTPQLSLIVSNDDITIHQNAILHNTSDNHIELTGSLLHYSRSQAPIMYKAERATMALQSSSQPTEYQNNEATYSLEDKSISLPAHTDTLYSLKNTKSKVEQIIHTANLFTRNNNSRSNPQGIIELNFQSHLQFSFTEDGLPGQYQILWQRGDLLIPGNRVFFNTVRQKQQADIITNNSLDLTGELTLVSTSSKDLPATQVWEAKIKNNSDQPQNFSIEQGVEGVLEQVAGRGTKQMSANSLDIAGQVNGHTTKVIRYTLKLKK